MVSVRIPVRMLSAYLYCPRLPYLMRLGVRREDERSARGWRLHEAYVALSVRVGRRVAGGEPLGEAVDGERDWLVGFLGGLGSPDPVGEAGFLAWYRAGVPLEGVPVRGEVGVRWGRLVGRVDLVEGGVPVEVKGGAPRLGDFVQAVAYGVALGAGWVCVDYLGRGRVCLVVGRGAAGYVEGLVGEVMEAVADPWGVPRRGGGCGGCPYRAECSLVFP